MRLEHGTECDLELLIRSSDIHKKVRVPDASFQGIKKAAVSPFAFRLHTLHLAGAGVDLARRKICNWRGLPLVAVFVRGPAFVGWGIDWRGFQRSPPPYECQKTTYGDRISQRERGKDGHLALASINLGVKAIPRCSHAVISCSIATKIVTVAVAAPSVPYSHAPPTKRRWQNHFL